MPRSTDRPVVPASAPSAAFVALGANLGDVRATLDAAFVALATLPETRLRAASSLYCTAPIESSGDDYLNAVVWLETHLVPRALFARLQRIERDHGRERPHRNAPRTLDLDLLLYGRRQIETKALTLPHPRMHQRAFVLHPLAEIAPEVVVGRHGPIEGLLAGVADQCIERLA